MSKFAALLTQADAAQYMQRNSLVQSSQSTISPPPFPIALLYTSCYCEQNVYHSISHITSQLSDINQTAVKTAKINSTTKTTSSLQPIQFIPIWDLYSVFISNPEKAVLLHQQKASNLPNLGYPVIWDYHVVALATCHLVPLDLLCLTSTNSIAAPFCFKNNQDLSWSQSWVYDIDSNLSSTSSESLKVIRLEEYNYHTFRSELKSMIPKDFRPQFRLVPANHFLNWFASDRSHMRNQDGVWKSPPPNWDLILGSKAREIGVRNNLIHNYVDMNVTEIGTSHMIGSYGKLLDAQSWFEQKFGIFLVGLGETIG
ncbi:uncharacterized protein MEPE_02276 [Melanopsichium pennsylvanicum]|uniref:Protein N-terminal glutamine amidohydrolase n=1 Tax=Melanopsichium pennsylvanicum TaxID=63383 RepID=A0AAJ4XJL6_9BASI|nr:uncharacterized protein MEPE_02276 [Melanopsichium pennsylvanicum]